MKLILAASILTVPRLPDQLGWQRVADAPTKRAAAACGVAVIRSGETTKVEAVVAGGTPEGDGPGSVGVATDLVEIFSFEMGRWRTGGGRLPHPMSGAKSVPVGDSFVLLLVSERERAVRQRGARFIFSTIKLTATLQHTKLLFSA